MSRAHSWGIQTKEKEINFPCDEMGYTFDPESTLYRAITIEAPAEEIYLWLCQLRFSSCSYDLIGSSKKKDLIATLYNQPELKVSQTFMDIFELIGFEKDIHITLSIKSSAGYPVESLAVSYLISQQNRRSCRLLCKAKMKYSEGPAGCIAKMVLPWGDLIMMRKQMLNIKRFAERKLN